MTLSAAKLRAAASTGSPYLPIEAEHGETLALALEIADESARIDIRSCGYPRIDGWLETNVDSPVDKLILDQAVRYPTARGMIEQSGTRVRLKA